MKTITALAKEYVEAMNAPANAHGAHPHPKTGQTTQSIMNTMVAYYGSDAMNEAIDNAMSK
jgi:hypothetical protein